MRVHVVHGIMDPVGTAGILALVPYFQAAGFECKVPDYGLITALEAKIVNPLLVRTLRPYMQPGDIWVGHSNGCAIGYELLITGVEFAGMVLINPALEPNVVFPPGVWADIYSNRGDTATVAAQVAHEFGLTDPVWGEMGHSGYTGSNPLALNVYCDKTQNMPVVDGHSDIFTPPNLSKWGPYAISRTTRRLAVH